MARRPRRRQPPSLSDRPMNFAAVKDFFRPLSRAERQDLARKHAGAGERSVDLEEVGIKEVAQQAAARLARDASPASGASPDTPTSRTR